MTNETTAPERRPVTKHDVIEIHRQHPNWTAPMIAKFLGCTPSYIHATAKRNGFTLKSARNKGLIVTLKTEISTLRSDLESAQARIAELEWALKLAEHDISYAFDRLGIPKEKSSVLPVIRAALEGKG